MAERGADAIVVGYRKDDPRRSVGERARLQRPQVVLGPGGRRIPLLGRVQVETVDLDCRILAGSCISCGRGVYVNALGYSAVVERDADVVCAECEPEVFADRSWGGRS